MLRLAPSRTTNICRSTLSFFSSPADFPRPHRSFFSSLPSFLRAWISLPIRVASLFLIYASKSYLHAEMQFRAVRIQPRFTSRQRIHLEISKFFLSRARRTLILLRAVQRIFYKWLHMYNMICIFNAAFAFKPVMIDANVLIY